MPKTCQYIFSKGINVGQLCGKNVKGRGKFCSKHKTKKPVKTTWTEIYCGNSQTIPEGYDVPGTQYKCLRKGIGTGMLLPTRQRDEFLEREREEPEERTFCGNGDVPEDYDRRGTLLECFKKGVGIGLAMPQEKRLKAQKRPPRMGKAELYSLAHRFNVKHENKTKKKILGEIINKMKTKLVL